MMDRKALAKFSNFFLEKYAQTMLKARSVRALLTRVFQSVVNSGQKMALRALYFIRALTKALTYY